MTHDMNSIPSDFTTTVNEFCVGIVVNFHDSSMALSKVIEKAEGGNAQEDMTRFQTALNGRFPALIAKELEADDGPLLVYSIRERIW
ncbi:unnamed protein product [Clonostachys solani]|uniref:Uncharacterized protein n=1 Tax=Clonostachys solani TaxID=160281 RepID=A0A9P0EQ50_9HYPO|nr:unnamed protein product [Clonostachys solani]